MDEGMQGDQKHVHSALETCVIQWIESNNEKEEVPHVSSPNLCSLTNMINTVIRDSV